MAGEFILTSFTTEKGTIQDTIDALEIQLETISSGTTVHLLDVYTTADKQFVGTIIHDT